MSVITNTDGSTQDGINELARNFWSIQSGYISYSGDSSLYNPFLQSVMDSLMQTAVILNYPIPANQTELELTRQFYVCRSGLPGKSRI
jgi:hypothetical protein